MQVGWVFRRHFIATPLAVLGNTKPDLLCELGPCAKVRASYFQYGPSNPVSKSFINGIIFQTKTASLQDLHIVWYVVLMFTNRLSDI